MLKRMVYIVLVIIAFTVMANILHKMRLLGLYILQLLTHPQQ